MWSYQVNDCLNSEDKTIYYNGEYIVKYSFPMTSLLTILIPIVASVVTAMIIIVRLKTYVFSNTNTDVANTMLAKIWMET